MRLQHNISIRLSGLLGAMLCLLITINTQAQISTKKNTNNDILDSPKVISDTTGFAEKAENDTVVIFYRNLKGERQDYDTSINLIHRLNVLGDWDINLGNLGTAYQSLKASVELPAEYTLLPNAMNGYRFRKNNIRFFNTTKPFTDVRYSIGSGQEQMMELFHTQNIKPNWNFNTSYRKINSQGFFKGQKSNIDNFEFVTDYISTNQRYKVNGALFYNKIQQDENLGILDEGFLTADGFSNRSIIPVVSGTTNGVTRSAIQNYNRDVNLKLNQSYSLGKKVAVQVNDTTEKMVFRPIITFGNEVYYTGERYCFQHNIPDSSFVSNFVNQFFNEEDTLNIQYDNRRVGTNFSAESNIYLGKRVFSLAGGLGIEYQIIGGTVASQESVNNYLFGTLTNRKSKDSSWRLDANIKFYYTGMARGNLNFSGRLSKDLPKGFGEIGIDGGQYIQRPYYVAESIQLDSFASNNQFLEPQLTTKLGGFYANKKLRLHASIHTLLFSKLLYSNGLAPDFQQWANPISIQQITVNKNFVFGKWTSTNNFLIQITPAGTPIQIPLYASMHSLAYNSFLFKGKLAISTGLDIQYNTPYYYDNYQPLFQSFTPQTTQQQIMIARVNPFFNFKIKRFRASINFDQVQHFLVENNLNYIRHPAQSGGFRFTLRWLFVN